MYSSQKITPYSTYFDHFKRLGKGEEKKYKHEPLSLKISKKSYVSVRYHKKLIFEKCYDLRKYFKKF